MNLEPGVIVDRYKIEGKLGQGGMGVVYRARHLQLGTAHAIKVVVIPSPSVRDRLLQEGRLQATLRHANIVAVTDVIDVQGSPGLVMELVEGPSLDDLLDELRLSIEQVDDLARGIIAGVAEAHRHGLIHRDLKPANVMLRATDHGFVPKVTDFGLAKILTGDDRTGGGQTETGVAMGTPRYMAPEQIRDAKAVDKRADLFSLGAVLYEMVTGARAFDGPDVLTIFTRVAAGAYTPITDLVPDAPERMVRAITAALQVDRDQRVPDCDALLAMWTGEAALPVSGGPWSEDVLGRIRATLAVKPPVTADATWERGTLGQTPEKPAPAPLVGAMKAVAAPLANRPRLQAGMRIGIGAVLILAIGSGLWVFMRRDPPAARAGGAGLGANPAVTAPAVVAAPAISGAVWTSPSLGEMKWIPPGSFVMGSPPDEPGRFADEAQHSVTLTNGFWMMEHEVTQGEWEGVMGTNPSTFTACGPRCPVEQVSWNDVAKFITEVSARDGVRYRLPSEAEWEFAARGGAPTLYAGSSDLGSAGWYTDNSGETSHAVCGKPANAAGLCDMSGNVWEWTADWFGEYPEGAVVDPTGPTTGVDRATRGGSWRYDAQYLRAAVRGQIPPTDRYHNLGFRLARSIGG